MWQVKMVQTRYIVKTRIFRSVWTGGWGGSWVTEELAELGDSLVVETAQTPNGPQAHDVFFTFSNGKKVSTCFETLGRYIGSGAIAQIFE